MTLWSRSGDYPTDVLFTSTRPWVFTLFHRETDTKSALNILHGGKYCLSRSRRLLNDHESLEASTAWSSMEPWDCASHHVWATQSVGSDRLFRGFGQTQVWERTWKRGLLRKHWRMYQANATSTCPRTSGFLGQSVSKAIWLRSTLIHSSEKGRWP